jgi:hypothetical protein
LSLLRFLEGLALIALAFGPIAAASRQWRLRWLPDWTGAAACLADIMIGTVAVVVVAEVLGAVHLFRIAAMVPALAIVGIVGWYAGSRKAHVSGPFDPANSHREADSASHPVGMNLIALGAVSVVMADWGTRTVDAYHHGMTTIDSLWYHLPAAARFVQDGSITPLHYFDSQATTAFYPANSELIHGLGIMFMGNDVLSPLLNMGWLAIALLAGWCIGRPFGTAPVTLTGVALLMAVPGLVATQPGGAYDDVVGIALFLCCAALLIVGETTGEATRIPSTYLTALVAGVALGTKVTLIGPVGLLTIGIWVLARRGRRLLEGSVWLLALAVTGAFWYLRNLIVVGNPLPSLNVRLGPVALPNPAGTIPSTTVVHYLFDGNAWGKYFLPGLRQSFGPAWWALLGLAVAGLLLGAVVGPRRMPRMLAWVGLASGAVFMVMPQALAILGAPVFFVDNVRYADVAVGIGLVSLPLVPMLRIKGRSLWTIGAYGALLAVTQLDGTIWPISLFGERFASPITGIDSLLGLVFGFIVFGIGLLIVGRRRGSSDRSTPGDRRVAAIVVIGLSLVLVATGFGLEQFYLRNRYAAPNPGIDFPVFRHVGDTRIAVAGAITQLQYELYGRQPTNYVQYVGLRGPHGGFTPITSCARWRQALNAGRYQYVVTSSGLVPDRSAVFKTPFSYTVWTGTSPAATLLQRVSKSVPGFSHTTAYVGFSLFRLHGALDPRGCASPANRRVVATQP